MATVVVDTNIVSFQLKRDTRARLYRRHLLGNDLILSFMSLAELDYWASRYNWGEGRRDSMERHLQGYEVFYADRDLCRLWAEVTDRSRRRGRTIADADAWIASTALALGASLVTHNAEDFAGVVGLKVLSESGS